MMKSRLLLLVLTLLTTSLITSCNSSKQAIVEQPPAAHQATAASTPITAPAIAPSLAEVQEAVKRVFKDAAVIHPDYKDGFLAGDFNGDLSQDLAVIVKPAPDKLAEMNEEFPRWLLRDPFANPNHRTPLRVEKDETLLAVIHGYGTNDWRDPEATQTFLLKNVVGTDMRVQNGREFVAANSTRKIPKLHGDLIGEKLKGSQGYLYYATATYSWYDPGTFKGQSETAGAFHAAKQ